MNSRDRQSIEPFIAASSGVRPAKAEGSKKRPRDDNSTADSSRRRIIGSPYNNISHHYLLESTRWKNSGSNSNSHSKDFSTQGHSRVPHHENAVDGFPSNGSILRYPDASVAASFPGGLTLETDAIMSGNPQNMLSFADLMDGASVPYSPQQGTIREGSTSSRLSGSNSVDSINAIDQPTSGPSTTPLRPVDGPTEDVVEEIWSGQHRPDTSKRETLFQKGRVKHVVESIISRTETETRANARPTLSPFLKLQPFKSSHPAFKVYPGQNIQAWGNLQSQE